MSVQSEAGGETPKQDHPSRSDRFVGGLSESIGGPLGTHAGGADGSPGRNRFWTAARIVLALTCLTLALHWVQKSPCQDGAWSNYVQYKQYCYTDVLALYYAEGLNEGKVPYLDHPVEYPVLTGVFMGMLGLPVHEMGQRNPALNQAMWFYNANAIVLSALAVWAVAAMLALRRRRPWDLALFALAPALFVTATVNWDLLAIAFAVFGIWAWARRWPVVAGVLLGLGTAAKLWPGFIFVALIFLAIRSRRFVPVVNAAVAGAVACVAVNVPFMVLNYENWDRFIELNRERGVDWGTLWYIGDHLPRGAERYGIEPFRSLAQNIPLLNNLTYLLIIAAWVAIGVLVLRAPRRPRLAQVAFLIVAAFLIFNKVWSQQFVLWLLPLAVLARPRWGAFLAWQFAELCYFLAFYGELMGASGKFVFPEWVFVLASALRLGTVVALCGFVVWDVLHPEDDAVRQTYADDPDGGVFDGAPDRVAARAADPGPGGDADADGTTDASADPAVTAGR
ncbi:MAG TPA: glycosyltransferase 87 family protein [Pilimelia sp.]|nr:glycosyltransferase 87 family protein [Pilimelia sp.]